jgi:dihydropteroate synthase-like protein
VEVVRSLRKDYAVDVVASKAPVAQFISSEELARELFEKLGRCDYDYVVVPGLIRGSTRVIEEVLGCRVFKGSRYAGDIPTVLELLEEGLELSYEVPADELYGERFLDSVEESLRSLRASKVPAFRLRGVDVYADPPPILLLLEVNIDRGWDFLGRVRRALEVGFDGVVVGCGTTCGRVDLLARAVSQVRDLVGDLPVGLDVSRPGELTQDLVDGVDLVMNITARDVDRVAGLLGSGRGVVVIPEDVSSPEVALSSVRLALERLEEVGVGKVVIDPLVKPPGVGLAESLVRFYHFRKSLSYPHLFSTANVYEMVDADSHGIVALLMVLALELGASVVLATEESDKTTWAVEEHTIARLMAYSSAARRSPPKDTPYGVDLLVLKEKRYAAPRPPEVGAPVRYVSTVPLTPDPRYFVRVYVDHLRGEVVVDVHDTASGQVLARYVGREATSLARAVVRDLTLTPEHAAYLGYELCKAELALKLRRGYTQDSEILRSPADKLRELNLRLPRAGPVGKLK